MPGPFVIIVGGSELLNWTDAELSRSKDDLTGSLSFSLFMSYMPGAPVQTALTPGALIQVYVGGLLAFVGSVDRRRGTGKKHGGSGTNETPNDAADGGNGGTSGSVSIGPDEYTVKITARGITKILVDSSHKHPTGTMLKPTTQDVVNKLVEGTNIAVDWQGTEVKLDKVRFRDGAVIWEEIDRIGHENAYYIYQDREGKLRVTDGTGNTTGDPLILGENILTFSAEQGEDESRGEIKVKGQRTPNDVWGEDALITTEKIIQDGSSTNKAPTTIQHYGDATPEALDRRAQFEANKRVAAAKEVNVDVFHVQSNVEPWDVGNVHYVEIPPEGIFEAMECKSLKYTVNAKDTLRTSLTLSPVPSMGISGGSANAFGAAFSIVDELISIAASRRVQLGVTTQPGQYPASWGGAVLSVIAPVASSFKKPKEDALTGLDTEDDTPAILPSTFGRGSR